MSSSAPIRVQAKAVKVTIPIESVGFPLSHVPPVGTPGAKSMTITYEVDYGGGTLLAQLKVPGLQKIAAAAAAAPQGGFVVIQGRLQGTQLLEAGAIFQAKPAEVAAADATA